jgi:hypothetical protein
VADSFQDGGGGGIGGIFDPIIGLLAAAINAIIAFLNALVAALVQVLNFLWAGELELFRLGFFGDSAILKWLRHVYQSIFQLGVIKALTHLWNLYQKLRAWLLKLKAWLDRWHQLQRQYMLTTLRRVINIIQRIRKTLVIFRLFHLKFAEKLDRWLAGIEGKIIQAVTRLPLKTNVMIAWLNYLLDPIGTLNKRVLVASIINALDDLMVAITGRKWASLFGVNIAPPRAPAKPVPLAQTMADSMARFAAGAGDEGVILARGAEMRARLFSELGISEFTRGR